MANFYEMGQAITVILIMISGLMMAVNATLEPVVPSGFIGGQDDLNKFAGRQFITDDNVTKLDSNLSEFITSEQTNNPFAFIGQAINGAQLAGGVLFNLLTGWTKVIDLIFNPFNLNIIGNAFKAVFGAIEVYTVFRFFIIIASVIRGGGG